MGISHSWEGEDVLIRKIMIDVFAVEKGFYVDVGAHHPFNLSNTAVLYSEGWRGVNIDACPGSMAVFQTYRPEDVNLEIAIGPTPGVMRFTQFTDPGLNGFLSDDDVENHVKRGIAVVSQVALPCRPLNEILSENVGQRAIDLMSIDVEGMDEKILGQLDFKTWRPKAIVVEVLGCHSVADVQETGIHKILRKKRYFLHSRLHFSCVYVDQAAYNYEMHRRDSKFNTTPSFLTRAKRKLCHL